MKLNTLFKSVYILSSMPNIKLLYSSDSFIHQTAYNTNESVLCDACYRSEHWR